MGGIHSTPGIANRSSTAVMMRTSCFCFEIRGDFCAKILAGRVRNTVENFAGCDEGGFAVGRRHVWKPECAK